MSRIGSLLIALAFSACVTAAPKQRIFRALPLEPEEWYEEIYSQVRECALKLGKATDTKYSDIEWYVVAHESMPGYVGLTSQPRRIYLDEAFVVDEWLIRHELGHAVIIRGHNRHDDPVFKVCTAI